MRISCPKTMRDHVRKVLAGEYDIPGLEFPMPPVIVDIGANIGAFSIWAMGRWPGCRVEAYEPHPTNAVAYRANLGLASQTGPFDAGSWTLHEVAVMGASPAEGVRVILYDGRNNCGEASLYRGDEQSHREIAVLAVRATELPTCDVLKLDCEGSELDIVRAYFTPTRPSPGPRAVMLEWHSPSSRYGCGHILSEAGFELVSDESWRKDRGIQKWIRK